MDKLSKFYVELSTDPITLEKFSKASIDVKKEMLLNAGVDDGSDIISLDQQQLQDLLAAKIASKSNEWANLSSNSNNNSVDDIGKLGIR